jgi:hypothetical protein
MEENETQVSDGVSEKAREGMSKCFFVVLRMSRAFPSQSSKIIDFAIGR